jgi:biotin operon repressor
LISITASTPTSLSGGEIAYEAVAADEPAGKHIRLTRKFTVRLRLIDLNTDLEALANYGLAGLRRHRLARLTRQAYDQYALLSYEDLAMILTTSPGTVKRDIAQLRHEGMFIITRGAKLDMGPGLSHKTIIIDLYLKNYTFSEIELKTNHSESSVKRYLADFIQVAILHQQNFSFNQIRLIAKKSDRLVREYIQLYQAYKQQNNARLEQLLHPQQPGEEAKKNPFLNWYKEIDAMSKPLTKEQIQLIKTRRLKDKNIKQLLLYRFLNHYGYDKGKITASAIIDDILKLVDDYFLVSTIDDDLHHLHYGQLVYMAVHATDFPKRGQCIATTRLKPVVLSFTTDEDVSHLAHGFQSAALRKKRIKRWCDQSFDQGGLLSQLDLSILLGVCDAVVSKYVNEIQKEGHLLPTRGNIHDLSGAVTHKREIITLYLEGYLTPEIALKTKHSHESVDLYIKDYHRVEMLWQYGITDLDQISQLARLAKRVVQQYIDLLPDKVKNAKNKSLASANQNAKLNLSGETETGSAEEQPVKG